MISRWQKMIEKNISDVFVLHEIEIPYLELQFATIADVQKFPEMESSITPSIR